MTAPPRLSVSCRLTSAVLWCIAWLSGGLQPALAQTPSMTAHFIDVGQAHATLLEFPCGAMLIDSGSDEQHQGSLVDYLERFFERRRDLERTLDLILITHNHIDHTRSLREVVEAFTVRRYIDNGFTEGSGVGQPNWLKQEVASGRLPVAIREIDQSQVDRAADHAGLTDGDIDPFDCPAVDPRIRILSGRHTENPGWTEGDFDNQNNHSLVTRIDYRQSSFLFMGDLQDAGIELLLELYGEAGSGLLNTDILQVGHHGSHNATTQPLLRAVTPTVAVIPVGHWTFGQRATSGFTTFAYGHPRQDVFALLSASIARRRPTSRRVMVAERARRFHQATVTKAVYATGWDGTVRVVATPAGRFTVFRSH